VFCPNCVGAKVGKTPQKPRSVLLIEGWRWLKPTGNIYNIQRFFAEYKRKMIYLYITRVIKARLADWQIASGFPVVTTSWYTAGVGCLNR